MTTLSVLTPSYNYARFIEDAIDSTAAQGLDAEHVVQDGASTDATPAILAGRGGLVWASEQDAGQSDALNRALRRARGTWVSWLNADEFYLPGGLSALIDHGERTGADVVYGDAAFVDESGAFSRLVPQHRFSVSILHNYGTFISTCACVIRRSAMPEDPFDPKLRLLMDRDLYMKLHAAGARYTYLDVPVGAFRVHGGRVSAGDDASFLADREVIAARYGAVPEARRQLARLSHVALKASGGAYRRQRRAREFRGRDLRWFASPEAMATALKLQRLYPPGAVTVA